MTEPAASRLLARHFFRRFLENDLLSPSGDAHESVTVALAFLVVAGCGYQPDSSSTPSIRSCRRSGHCYRR